MIGFGPVLLDSSQVTDVDTNGNFIMGSSSGMDQYKDNMLKIQKLMVDIFAVEAKANDQLANISDLSAKLGGSNSAEND